MPDSPLRPIKTGELLIVTYGAYDQYHIEEVLRATGDLDTERLIEEWLTMHPEYRDPHSSFHSIDFFRWLIERKLIEPLDYAEWWLGDGGGVREFTIENYEPYCKIAL